MKSASDDSNDSGKFDFVLSESLSVMSHELVWFYLFIPTEKIVTIPIGDLSKTERRAVHAYIQCTHEGLMSRTDEKEGLKVIIVSKGTGEASTPAFVFDRYFSLACVNSFIVRIIY